MGQKHGLMTGMDPKKKKSCYALAKYRLDNNELVYIICDHPNLLLGPPQRKNYKINTSQVYPSGQGRHFAPRACFLRSLDMPHVVPSRP